MFSIYDNLTGTRISNESYRTVEEANRDYHMNEWTHMDIGMNRPKRSPGQGIAAEIGSGSRYRLLAVTSYAAAAGEDDDHRVRMISACLAGASSDHQTKAPPSPSHALGLLLACNSLLRCPETRCRPAGGPALPAKCLPKAASPAGQGVTT